MKKNLSMMTVALAAVIFAGCSKDDEGGISEGRFSVQVPSSVTCTTRIPVRFSVACDSAPTITFTTDGDALGIVSIDGFTSFESEKIYAGNLSTSSSPVVPLQPSSVIFRSLRVSIP